MKIKNGIMVKFLNTSNEILQKRLPIRLYYAINLNLKTFGSLITSYQEAYEKAKGSEEELVELVNQEIEAPVQTVSQDTLELIDSNDKFDSLTWAEFEAIQFMIE